MPRGFLNRSVQIQPKSWREIVQVIFSQVLNSKNGSEKLLIPSTRGAQGERTSQCSLAPLGRGLGEG